MPLPSREFSGSGRGGGVIKVSDDLVLLVGKRGELFRYSTRIGKAFADLQPTKDSGADDTALKKLIDHLPPYLLNSALLTPFRTELAVFEAKRDTYSGIRTAAENDQTSLSIAKSKLLILDTARQDFGAFMATCRNGILPGTAAKDDKTGPSPEPLTLACIEGWKAEQASEQQSWWGTLAEQVPQGVLLLFLLATLGGLYRYNLRLAAFHHSRADALELLSIGREAEAAKGALSPEEVDALGKIANALAADKVPFSNARTPVDQAVDVVRAVAQKS